MNSTTLPENVIELPGRHSVDSTAFQLLVIVLAVIELGIAWAVMQGWFWLAVPLALVASHFMHGVLVGFHEASHGLLRRNRRFNEFDGVLTGLFSFTSFSLYRAAHQTHHAFLATERDEELWPFVDTSKPRWARRLAAFLELNVGLLFTPLLFLRTFFRKDSPIRNRKVRRRIWAEILMIVVVWSAVFWAVNHWQVWTYFAWMYGIPAVLASNMQSWRKYIEHVGLTSDTVKGATRTIVSRTRMGRFLAYTLLHEPYHGVHHLHSGIPHEALPHMLPEFDPNWPDEQPPYPSYWTALKHLIRNLADPRVGAQWNHIKPS